MMYLRVATSVSIVVSLLLPSVIFAATTVNVCESDIAEGRNLENAISNGGEIRFGCVDSTTIMIKKSYTITKDTVIDGQNIITMKATARPQAIFKVGPNTHLTLRGLTFVGLGVPSASGTSSEGGLRLRREGSVVHADQSRCSLNVEGVVVRDSYDPIIFDCTDSEGLNISSSQFINNKGSAVTGQKSVINV